MHQKETPNKFEKIEIFVGLTLGLSLIVGLGFAVYFLVMLFLVMLW
jgi:hypothetical protein